MNIIIMGENSIEKLLKLIVGEAIVTSIMIQNSTRIAIKTVGYKT
jgi:hypothetical protein